MLEDKKRSLSEDLARAALIEKKKAQLQEMELEIRENRAIVQKSKLDEARKNSELAKNASFGTMSDDKINALIAENTAYIESAQNNQSFICPIAFKGIIPFYRKNLIFIGAKTGEGKSTAVANIVRGLISETNANTGTYKRALVITNEEKAEDFYNRITCLIMGWHYVNHDKFTPQQLKILNDYMKILPKLVTVISDDYLGGSGMTTTPEGLELIFERLIAEGIWYDAVLIDYYQNFTWSQKDPTLNEWAVQAKLASILDRYKNTYPAPIVIFGQITPAQDGKETEKPFEYRIKGRKQIIVPATFVMEMVADRKTLSTKWIIHKGRFSESVGSTIITGYKNGQFVEYSAEFKADVLRRAEQRARDAMNKASGVNFLGTKEEKKEEAPTLSLVPKIEPPKEPNA